MAGKLFIVGGGMDEHSDRIFTAFLEAAGGKNAKIAMVLSASGEDPDDTFGKYQRELVRLGARSENVILIPLYGKQYVDERGYNALTGDEPSLVPLFDGVTGVWFTGGDQYFTAECFLQRDGGFTRALELIDEIYQNGGALGGTSAGAAIMSRVMIGFGNARGVISREVRFGYGSYDPLADEDDDPTEPLLLASGLGFFPYGVVDQHFNRRPRLLRLIEACLANRENARVGFGVSEDTALVFDNGAISVLGAAGVYLVDCRAAQKTAAASYENVSLHVLYEGDSCDVNLERVALAANARAEEAHYLTPDWVSGLTPDSPAFSALIRDKLLYARENCLSTQKSRPCCKGLSAYDCDGKTYAVKLTYRVEENAKAYEAAGGLSFTGVTLDVETAEIPLRYENKTGR